MADPDHLAKLDEGVAIWNRWRQAEPDVVPDLAGADLQGRDLVGVFFGNTKLARADLSGANLHQANFARADLTAADLSHSNLHRSIMSAAELAGANAEGAHFAEAALNGTGLAGANLNGANLRGAQITSARMQGATLRDARVSDVDFSRSKMQRADLTLANLRSSRFVEVDLSDAVLEGADLEGASLVNCRLRGTRLVNCTVFGINAWHLDLEGAAQAGLVITSGDQPPITVDDLEVAQFVYLMLDNRKIRNVIDTVTSKAVLILGRFSQDRKPVLEAFRTRLRARGFLPIIFDFEKPASRNLLETVTTLARLSKFIVVDITDPRSVPQELISIVQTMPSLPIQPLLAHGQQPWAMYESIVAYPWVRTLQRYSDAQDAGAVLDRLLADDAASHAAGLPAASG